MTEAPVAVFDLHLRHSDTSKHWGCCGEIGLPSTLRNNQWFGSTDLSQRMPRESDINSGSSFVVFGSLARG